MPRRPVSVTVIAILQLIFGVSGLLCGVCSGLVASGVLQPPVDKDDKAVAAQQAWTERMHAAEAAGGAKGVEYVSLVATPLLAVLMIVSGIGMLQMKPWGRSLCLAWAVLAVLWEVALLAYTWIFAIPLYRHFVASDPPPSGPASEAFISGTMLLGGLVPIVPALYALVVLIIMVRSSVALAFQGGAPPPLQGAIPADGS